MISPLDARTQRFLSDLEGINARITTAQGQISSGRRINRASDAPDEISSLLAVRSELAATQQTHSNFNRVKGEVDAAEQALQQAVNILDRVASLGAEGATDIMDPAQKKIIASELAGLEQQLVGLAGSATDGRYIFAGDFDQRAPYLFDINAAPPYGVFQGSAATRQILHPAGTRVTIAHTAQQIFEDPSTSKNVFGAVESLRQALLGGNTKAVSDALSQVRTSSVHLNNELAFYGTAQNEVASALDYSASHEIRLRTQIASTEEADLAASIVEMNQAQLHQQAVLQAEAKIQTRRTLFDYLR
jgi:flagellar hook-associated protein 3 FlgL